ncbi:MAG: IS1595 family transposase [Caulobacteraceae bacterium]
MSILHRPHFHDEAAAFEYVEAALWPQGPVCPHCGCMGRISVLAPFAGSKSKKHPEGALRVGVKFCGDCRKQFTVRVGTIFEESKLPMTKWLQAIFLMVSSKKGVSSHQLMRTLETTYKTAWFLSHRVREAMREGDLAPFGSGGGDVEVDETYIGVEPGTQNRTGGVDKMKVLRLIDRTTGRSRSMVLDNVNTRTIAEAVSANLAQEARLITDQATYYKRVGATFAAHVTVNHSVKEYVSKLDPSVHTNTIEGSFSIFKRGMRGVYQHCAKKHLHRYLAEFDFRYSHRVALGIGDEERAGIALDGFRGRRLTYRGPDFRPKA